MPSTFFFVDFFFFHVFFFPICLSLHIYLLLSTRSTSLHTCGHWILTVQEDLLNRVLRGKIKFLLVHFWMKKNCCEFIIVLMGWCGWSSRQQAHPFFFSRGPNEGVSEVQVSGSPKLPVFLVFVHIFAPKLSKGGRAVWSESAGNVCLKHRTRRHEELWGKENGNPSNSVAAYRLRDFGSCFCCYLSTIAK